MAGLLVDDPPDLIERDREIARDAGHQRVGVALRDHRGGEGIAVGVDEALAVAQEIAAPLQALVEELRVEGVALREPRVVDLDALVGEVEAGLLRRRLHAILAPDQDRRPQALADERIGGADDLRLFALGEDDALCMRRTRSTMRCSAPAIGSRRAESCAL